MDGRAQPAQMAGLARSALAMKGERPAEIVGLARTMRARAAKLSSRRTTRCSTPAAPAATARTRSTSRPWPRSCWRRAACAWPSTATARVSSRCGSADLFEALGVNIAAPPAVVERCLDEAGIAFLFAQTFHPSMRHAAQTRRDLGVRTAFNLLGPLTNPAGASRQLVGVPRPELTELVARSLALLGAERAWVVHGADGLDEISTTGYTKVSECRDGAVNTFYLHPADFGLAEGVAARTCAAAMPPTTPRSRARCSDGEPGARARHRAAQCRGASLLRRRTARHDVGRDRHGGRGDRQRPRPRRAASKLVAVSSVGETAEVDGSTTTSTAGSARAPSSAATRRIVEVREAAAPAAVLARSQRDSRGGREFEQALAGPRRCDDGSASPRVIAECKRRSPSQGHPARGLRSGGARARVCRRRRRGDLGADRADVLRRHRRSPCAPFAPPSTCRSCARTSSSRTTRSSRPRRSARMRCC